MSHANVFDSSHLYDLYQNRFLDITDEMIDKIVHNVVYYVEEKLYEYKELPFTIKINYTGQPINKESAMKISNILKAHYGLIVDVNRDGFCIVKDIVKVGENV